MPVEQPCPPDSPLMKAWTAYKETDDFKNSEKWARLLVVNNEQGYFAHPHLTGSMWAMFMAGWIAAGGPN